MKDLPLVSIIMPVYNGSNFIQESINSVINQHYDNWELIIIDDFSFDASNQIIKENLKINSKIKYIRNKINLGPLESRNIGISSSRGKYIAFLDQDDVWTNDKLLIQINFMLERGVSFTYTNYRIFDDNKKYISKTICSPNIYRLGTLFSNTGIALSSVVYDRIKCGTVYFEIIKPYTEFDLYLRLISMVNSGYLVPNDLLRYRITPASMSANKFMMAKMVWKNYRRCGFSLPVCIYFFFSYAFHAVSRRFLN